MDDTAGKTQNNKEKEDLKYDHDGNRLFKDSTEVEKRKYIVDIAGDLPVILMELDSADNMDIMKKYIYAHGQVLAQHEKSCRAYIASNRNSRGWISRSPNIVYKALTAYDNERYTL